MATGDVYEVIDVQRLDDQEMLNVYFYQQVAATVPLSGTIAYNLAEAWATAYVPLIAAVQSISLVHEEIRCRNLFDPSDIGVYPVGIAGAQAIDEFAPTFSAYGMKLEHDNGNVRPGGKRIPGVVEATMSDGVVNADTITNLTILADALEEPIPAGIIIEDDVMFPVVVQRIREGEEPDWTYRLPATPSELVVGRITEIVLNALVTSQVSRKIGTGV